MCNNIKRVKCRLLHSCYAKRLIIELYPLKNVWNSEYSPYKGFIATTLFEVEGF